MTNLSGLNISPTEKSVEEFIRKSFINKKKYRTQSDDWDIDFIPLKEKKGLEHIKDSRYYQYLEKHPKIKERRQRYIVASENIIGNAVYGGWSKDKKKDKKPNVEKYHYFYSKVNVDGKLFLVKIHTEQYVGESEKKPQTVHYYDITEAENGGIYA